MTNNCLLLLRIVEKLMDFEDSYLQDKGMNIAKMRILFMMKKSDKDLMPFHEMMDLALLKCSQPTFSRMMDAHEESGYINVVKSEEDARGKLASLTAQGVNLCNECMKKMNDVENILLKGLSKEEVSLLFYLLEKVHQNTVNKL